jgi:hypothetical protein
MSRFVRVGNFPNRVEAEYAKSLLESEEIPAMISGDDAGGWAPEDNLARGGVDLLVSDENAERAARLLQPLE